MMRLVCAWEGSRWYCVCVLTKGSRIITLYLDNPQRKLNDPTMQSNGYFCGHYLKKKLSNDSSSPTAPFVRVLCFSDHRREVPLV